MEYDSVTHTNYCAAFIVSDSLPYMVMSKRVRWLPIWIPGNRKMIPCDFKSRLSPIEKDTFIGKDGKKYTHVIYPCGFEIPNDGTKEGIQEAEREMYRRVVGRDPNF